MSPIEKTARKIVEVWIALPGDPQYQQVVEWIGRELDRSVTLTRTQMIHNAASALRQRPVRPLRARPAPRREQ